MDKASAVDVSDTIVPYTWVPAKNYKSMRSALNLIRQIIHTATPYSSLPVYMYIEEVLNHIRAEIESLGFDVRGSG